MRLKLAFSHAEDGLFRVDAFHPGMDESRTVPFFRLEYANKGEFLRLLDEAGLDAAEHIRVMRAIVALGLSPSEIVCCDDISLNEAQMLILLGGAIRSQIALPDEQRRPERPCSLFRGEVSRGAAKGRRQRAIPA
jgi:hypothetical protein